MGYYNEFLFEDAITWTTDGANAGTVHFRKGKFYCTNVCGVLLNSYGYTNRCIAEILGRVSKRYVSYVGNPKLMNNVMSEICIYIPSLAEQSHIDDFLLVLDKKIEKQRQLVDSLKKYSECYKLFRFRLTFRPERMCCFAADRRLHQTGLLSILRMSHSSQKAHPRVLFYTS